MVWFGQEDSKSITFGKKVNIKGRWRAARAAKNTKQYHGNKVDSR